MVTSDKAPSKEVKLSLAAAVTVWKSAMGLSERQADCKRKEAVGWMITAAKLTAEEEMDSGKDLADCLRAAAQILLDKAEEWELTGGD